MKWRWVNLLRTTHLIIFGDNIRDHNHDWNPYKRNGASVHECTNGELNEIEGVVNPSAYCWTSFTECTSWFGDPVTMILTLSQRWAVVDTIQTMENCQVEPVPPQPANLCCYRGQATEWVWRNLICLAEELIISCMSHLLGSSLPFSALGPLRQQHHACTALPATWFKAAAPTFSCTCSDH